MVGSEEIGVYALALIAQRMVCYDLPSDACAKGSTFFPLFMADHISTRLPEENHTACLSATGCSQQ